MFSAWLNAALERRNWTSVELARRAAQLGGRVPERAIAGLRNGAPKQPDAALVVLLARALGEPPGEALLATGRPGPGLRSERLDRPLLVGVTGGTGAGKSFVSTWIVGLLGRRVAERVEMDWYLRAAKPGSSPAARAAKNYDVPAVYEVDRLIRDLRKLRLGEAVAAPRYDFARHTRASEHTPVRPAPVIVVEGLFLFHDPRLRNLLDLKLFVEAAERTRFQRRLGRDQAQRGRSPAEVRWRFREHAQPGYQDYVEPKRVFADLILLNGGGDLQLPRGLEVAVAWMRQRHKRWCSASERATRI